MAQDRPNLAVTAKVLFQRMATLTDGMLDAFGQHRATPGPLRPQLCRIRASFGRAPCGVARTRPLWEEHGSDIAATCEQEPHGSGMATSWQRHGSSSSTTSLWPSSARFGPIPVDLSQVRFRPMFAEFSQLWLIWASFSLGAKLGGGMGQSLLVRA